MIFVCKSLRVLDFERIKDKVSGSCPLSLTPNTHDVRLHVVPGHIGTQSRKTAIPHARQASYLFSNLSLRHTYFGCNRARRTDERVVTVYNRTIDRSRCCGETYDSRGEEQDPRGNPGQSECRGDTEVGAAVERRVYSCIVWAAMPQKLPHTILYLAESSRMYYLSYDVLIPVSLQYQHT